MKIRDNIAVEFEDKYEMACIIKEIEQLKDMHVEYDYAKKLVEKIDMILRNW